MSNGSKIVQNCAIEDEPKPEIVSDCLYISRDPDEIGFEWADHNGISWTVDVADHVGLALLWQIKYHLKNFK